MGVASTDGEDSAEIAAFSMDHFRAWRESTDVFESMAVYQDRSFNLTGSFEPARVEAQSVSPSLFPLLGVETFLGRWFSQEEARDRVALLSHGLWQRSFGGEEEIAGKTIHLDGEPYDVVGLMPRASVRIVSPGFFRAMGIRLVSGRALGEDDREGAPRVVVVNESLARRYFEGQDPTAARIHRLREIAGVVRLRFE